MKNKIKELELEIVRLQHEDRLKTGWISLIAHDTKEIFGSLLWLVNALENQTLSHENFFKMLPQVKKDAVKNLQTIQNTTEWLKTQYGNFQPKHEELHVYEIFQELKNEHNESLLKKQLDFQFVGDKKKSIKTDRVLIIFILNKLLHNAIKYSKPGQEIIFQISVVGKNAVLTVEDWGIGIGEKHLKHIMSFDTPVFQGTNGELGAGLSLKIVENFVFLLNGKLEIVSSENKGTQISVFLPQI